MTDHRRSSQQEIETFLARPLTRRLGCLDDEGDLYVVPCLYLYADGGFYLAPRARAAWAHDLNRDGRVSLSIDVSYDEPRAGSIKVALRASRERLIAEAVPGRATLVFTHKPFPAWGRIVTADTGYRWERT